MTTAPHTPMTWEQALDEVAKEKGSPDFNHLCQFKDSTANSYSFNKRAAELYANSVKAQAEPKWISVDERLPLLSADHHVCYKQSGIMGRYRDVVMFDHINSKWLVTAAKGFKVVEVTHWMENFQDPE